MNHIMCMWQTYFVKRDQSMIGYFKASRSHHPLILRTPRNACPIVPENSRAGEGGGIGRRRSVVERRVRWLVSEKWKMGSRWKEGGALNVSGQRVWMSSGGNSVGGLLWECVTRSNVQEGMAVYITYPFVSWYSGTCYTLIGIHLTRRETLIIGF